MPVQKIVTGQPVPSKLLDRAKKMRRKMTPAEAKLWGRLRAGRLERYHFRRQQVIDCYIVDFYCHQAELVVEVDGEVHLKQREYDRERDLHLQERGLKVLRFTNSEVDQHLEDVLSSILSACHTAGVE